jgi:hypothetical protein
MEIVIVGEEQQAIHVAVRWACKWVDVLLNPDGLFDHSREPITHLLGAM